MPLWRFQIPPIPTLDLHSSDILCFFLPLPRLSLYMGCSPFLHLGTVLQLSRSRSNKSRMWSHPWARQPQGPRTSYIPHFWSRHAFYCVFICSWAPPGQRLALFHICIPPAQPPCSINVWWITDGKNVHHQKIAHQSPVHQCCQEMFHQMWFLSVSI